MTDDRDVDTPQAGTLPAPLRALREAGVAIWLDDLSRELLRSGDLSLEAISERCGFANSQRFSVLFRQHTGLPPGKFRRAHRQPALLA